MWKEFKEFAMKGNVLDLAIGVIIGAAFSKIVTSFVKDIIMPVLSLLTGKMDFSNLFVALDGKEYVTMEAAQKAGAATLNYGVFITSIIDFFLVAFSIFIVVKQINRFKAKTPPLEITTKNCPYCQNAISLQAVRCPHCTSALE